MRPRPIALQSFVAQLAALPGVERVVLDDRATVAVLICRPGAAHSELAEAAGTCAGALGLGDVDIEITQRAVFQRDSRRIRFIGVARDERHDRTVEFTVRLEWNGTEVAASRRADPGEALELRAVAGAVLEAVSEIVTENLELRIAGVKQVRSFDADLMVVSLHHGGPPRQQLVGAVVAGDDPYRATCLAVLNALNRLLGNYLAR